jgi:hypothetical protein
MALKDSDIREHNNPNNAHVDSDFVRGGARVVNTLTELYALASINVSLGVSKQDQLKQDVTIIKVLNTDTTNISAKFELININDTTGTGASKVFNSTAFLEIIGLKREGPILVSGEAQHVLTWDADKIKKYGKHGHFEIWQSNELNGSPVITRTLDVNGNPDTYTFYLDNITSEIHII